MELREYWRALKGLENRTALAEACGSTVGYFKLLASGHAKASADLAIRIEAATGGEVRCEDVRPDIAWYVIRGNAPADRGSNETPPASPSPAQEAA